MGRGMVRTTLDCGPKRSARSLDAVPCTSNKQHRRCKRICRCDTLTMVKTWHREFAGNDPGTPTLNSSGSAACTCWPRPQCRHANPSHNTAGPHRVGAGRPGPAQKVVLRGAPPGYASVRVAGAARFAGAAARRAHPLQTHCMTCTHIAPTSQQAGNAAPHAMAQSSPHHAAAVAEVSAVEYRWRRAQHTVPFSVHAAGIELIQQCGNAVDLNHSRSGHTGVATLEEEVTRHVRRRVIAARLS